MVHGRWKFRHVLVRRDLDERVLLEAEDCAGWNIYSCREYVFRIADSGVRVCIRINGVSNDYMYTVGDLDLLKD